MEQVALQFKQRRFLVTGASGFIGAHVCRQLLARGAEVYGVSHLSPPPADLADGVCWQRGDLSEAGFVQQLMASARPDVILHLASYVSGTRALEGVLPTLHSNLVSSINLLRLATESGCQRLVLAGSLEEPDSAQTRPIPASPYAAAKWASSAYARMFFALYQTPVVIARMFMVYGPGQRDLRKLVPYVILSLLHGQPPRLSRGTRLVDWIYVDDLVNGLLQLSVHPRTTGRTLDLGTGKLVPVREVVEHLVTLTGAATLPQFGAVAERPMEQVRAAEVAATTALLGWAPVIGLKEGLTRTIDWYARQVRDGTINRTDFSA